MKKIIDLIVSNAALKLFVIGVIITLVSWPIPNENLFIILRLIAFAFFFVAFYKFMKGRKKDKMATKKIIK